MRYTPFLITNLRRFFTIMRVLSIALLFVVPLELLPGQSTFMRGSVELDPTASTGRKGAHAEGNGIEFRRLSAEVRLEGAANDADLRALKTTVYFPQGIILAAAAFVICDTFRRLLRNAEAGTIFELENVALLRRLGWVTLFWSLLFRIFAGWASYRIGAYLTLHGGHAGFVPATVMEYVWRAAPSLLGTFVEVAVIFVLAEVFRYGVTLKQETDLTV